jgi:hypothetical protein
MVQGECLCNPAGWVGLPPVWKSWTSFGSCSGNKYPDCGIVLFYLQPNFISVERFNPTGIDHLILPYFNHPNFFRN